MSRTCYVYVIGWRSLDLWYCGVRYRKECHPNDLWVSYHTSSKSVAKIRVNHGEPDVIRVMRIFGEDHRSARNYEQRLLARFNVLNNPRWVNKAIGGHYAGRSGPHTAETKLKIAEKLKGKKRLPISEQQKQKQRATFAKNYEANKEIRFANRSTKQKGRKISEETRAKISASLVGNTLSEETRRKISEASKQQSQESRAKQAAALRGIPKTSEHRAKIGAANKGRVMSDEQRKLLSVLKTGKPLGPKTPEQRAKMSGTHWFTDGIKNVKSRECPVGFRLGRTFSRYP